jgi:enamine deaminase RidA (YjgF/YER057c/UK114 family)
MSSDAPMIALRRRPAPGEARPFSQAARAGGMIFVFGHRGASAAPWIAPVKE